MREAHREGEPERLAGVLVLIISSALAALVAFSVPQYALCVLLLNAAPVFSRTARVVRQSRRPDSVE
jgi:hypothetical protein